MYTQVWNKYLPIIRILIKRSITAGQTLAMNATDFERAGGGRKAAAKFSIRFSNGRLEGAASASPIARDLVSTLLQDEVIKTLFKQNDYLIDMTSKFQLNVTCFQQAEPEGVPAEKEQPVAESMS